jgi:hypothetical protein
MRLVPTPARSGLAFPPLSCYPHPCRCLVRAVIAFDMLPENVNRVVQSFSRAKGRDGRLMVERFWGFHNGVKYVAYSHYNYPTHIRMPRRQPCPRPPPPPPGALKLCVWQQHPPLPFRTRRSAPTTCVVMVWCGGSSSMSGEARVSRHSSNVGASTLQVAGGANTGEVRGTTVSREPFTPPPPYFVALQPPHSATPPALPRALWTSCGSPPARAVVFVTPAVWCARAWAQVVHVVTLEDLFFNIPEDQRPLITVSRTHPDTGAVTTVQERLKPEHVYLVKVDVEGFDGPVAYR